MLLCPKCNHYLTPLTITTDAQGKIDIDHCYFCGGVWFDHYEINRIPYQSSLYLSRTASSEDLKKINGSNICPRDQTNLGSLQAESIPQGLTVLSCPICRGNFITKNDLKDLKKAQKIKLNYFKTWKIPLPSISAVFIPVFVLFAASLGVFFTVQNVRQNQEARIKANELISTPTIMVSARNSVLINFTTNVPVLSSIAYQAKDGREPHTVPVSTQKKTSHTVTVLNLEANIRYTLKIYIEEIPGQIISSPTYTFMTN